jgi:hypothetical protein
MKLSIIPSDQNVVIDGLSKQPLIWAGTPNDVHALQWVQNIGSVELKNPIRNEEINVLPDWALNAVQAWEIGVIPEPLPPATKEQNKLTAQMLLTQTDWTTIPDVSDPQKSNPYLANANDFVAYRNLVRAIAINPPEGDIIWPIQPINIWV